MRERVTVGGYEVVALLDVAEDLDDPGGMVDQFHSPSNEAWEPYRALYPELFGARGQWHLFIRAFLIRNSSRSILVDTGVGPSTAPSAAWFPKPGALQRELAAAGADAGEIDSVVIPHVHDDHIGGTCTRDGTPAFPKARYLVHRADVDWLRALAGTDEESKEIWTLLLDPVEASDQLVEIDDAHDVAPGVRTRHLPGHTPGHQGLELSGEDGTLFLTADSFNHPAQLDQPEWAGDSDNDPGMANTRRRALLEELVDSDRLVAPTHFAEPFGRIVTDGGRVVWRPD